MRTIGYYLFAVTLVFALTEDVTAQDDPADALVHSYTFEDGTPTDQVGEADGSLIAGASVENGDLVLSDAGQYMEMPAGTIGINTFDAATIEISYTPMAGANSDTNPFTMLAYFGATNPENNFGVDYWFISSARGDDVSRAAISVGEDAEPFAVETGVNGPELDDGQLHHMVSTLTGSQISLYIDGELVGTADLVPPNEIGGISSDDAYLGRGGYTPDPTWIGTIHEFNIYDEALTAEQVAALYSDATSADEPGALPAAFNISQNHPNPFSGSTTIEYSVSSRSFVDVSVFDLLGNKVATLVHDETGPGTYDVRFDGSSLASGVYFCTMQAGSFRATKKLMLLR